MGIYILGMKCLMTLTSYVEWKGAVLWSVGRDKDGYAQDNCI